MFDTIKNSSTMLYIKAHYGHSTASAVKYAEKNTSDKSINYAKKLLSIKNTPEKLNEIKKSHDRAVKVQKYTQLINVTNELSTAKNVLKDIRTLFKGSQYKSPNKVRHDESAESAEKRTDKLIEIRSLPPEHALKESARIGVGNCGEYSALACVLLNERGIPSSIVEYDDNINYKSDHAASIVKINENFYVIDPWANIFCDHSTYIEKLVAKVKKWEGEGKLTITSNDIDSKTVILTHQDYRNLTLSRNYYPDIDHKSIAEVIESTLSKKAASRQP